MGTSLASFAKPVNVILITLDTTRADRMGFLNAEREALTPNLNSLARQSAVFTRAYSQVPLTTPSHATILTGTYPQFHHVSDLGFALAADLPYLPAILREHGYRTAAFVGSQILDPKGAGAPGFDRGFDTYDAPFHMRAPGEDRYQSVERRGTKVVDGALAWLNQPQRGPFFLWLHFYDPHDPYDPPPPFNTRFANFPYDGEIAYTDSVIGKLLTALRSRGLYDESLIVVVADHGEAFGEHGERSHGLFLYDETLHVPLLMKLPGSGSIHPRIGSRVGLVDIAPTLLHEMGISAPAAMQGKSLLALIKASASRNAKTAQSDVQDRPQYAETDYPYRAFGWSSLRAWRAGKFLYIDSPKAELYDQPRDPGATQNMVSSAPSVAATMSAQLAEFRRKTGRSGGAEAALTAHQVQQLQALGYVTSGSTQPEDQEKQPRPDPKDKVEIANLLHEALLDEEEEQYREAIPLFEQILKADPNVALANLQLGRAWNRVDEYAKAIPWLRKAVELTPQSAEAHYELAAALQETGDLKGSVEHFEAAAAQDSSSDELHFRLGAAYEEMDRADDALKQYSAALALNPENFRANLFLGRLFAIQDRPKDALPLLQKAVNLDPQSEDAHKFLGNVYTVLGELEKARIEQNEAQRLRTTPRP